MPERPGRRRNRWRAAIVDLGVIVALLFAVSHLPPDTSLSERRRLGTLNVCVPASAPPLVTGDPARPGFEIAALEELARRLDLRLVVNVSPAIGRDFNPRNWNLTRAQCDIVAGGLADTAQTRALLQTIPTGLATGWALVTAEGRILAAGDSVGVLPGSGGLSRVALSSHLRGLEVRPVVMPSLDAMGQALARGEIAGGIAERLVAERLAEQAGLTVAPFAPEALGGADLALGLWKGDQTLKRAVSREFRAMGQDGTLARIGSDYGIASASWAEAATGD